MVLAFVSNPDKPIPISEHEVSEAELPQYEEEIRSLEESPISLRMSGPNERLSRNAQSDEELAAVHSP